MRREERAEGGHGFPSLFASIGCAAVLVLWANQAQAAPGPQAACKALAARVAQAVNLKKDGVAAEKALADLSALSTGDAVPAGDEAGFFSKRLPSAVRFAYVAGMSPENAAAYYLKQCRIGS